MRICVIAGMIDAKLHSKILPLQLLPETPEIHLVRRRMFTGDHITCHAPPQFLQGITVAAEAWKVALLVYVLLFRRPRVIVAFGIVPNGIYAAVMGTLLGIPVIQHVMGKNDMRLTFPGQRGRALSLMAVRLGAQIAVRGRAMRAWLESRGIAADRIFIQRNVHDFSRFSAGAGPATYDLIYAGLLKPYKRVDLLLDAFALLCRQRENSSLLIVGDGPLRTSLQQRAAQAGVADNVTFAGEQPYDTLPEHFSSARVFVMTSQGEGLPAAMIEAFSCGLPAVIPDDADFADAAADGVNALVVRSRDPADYAAAYARVLTDTALYERLRKGALDFAASASEEYSAAFQARVWERAINRCVAR